MNRKVLITLIALWLLLLSLILLKLNGSTYGMPDKNSVKGWTVVSGQWSTIPGATEACRSEFGKTPSYLIKEETEQRNYIIEVNARVDSRKNDIEKTCLIGLVARYNDTGNNYFLTFTSEGVKDGKLVGELQAVKNYGGERLIMKSKAFTMEFGRYHRFKGVVTGSKLELFIDGSKQLSVMDGTLAYGGIGLVSGGCSSDFNDFSIEKTIGNEKPDSCNTGPIFPHNVAQCEGMTISKDDTVIEDISVNGSIYIKANNVVIRNFIMISDKKNCFGIQIEEGYSGIVLEDGEIDGTGFLLAGVSGSNYTARRLNIHNSGVSGFIAGENVNIEECWVHELGMAAGSSADGIRISSGKKVRIIGNNIEVPFDKKGTCGSVIFIKPDFGDINDVMIDRNWINGGNFSIYSIDSLKDNRVMHTASEIQITRNRFGRNYRYGVKDINDKTKWEGNIWENGEPVQ